MEWVDEGLLLRVQPHGESSVIATFFTHYHGLTTGYIRVNKKYPLQQGMLYHIKRKARLAAHLGLLSVEPEESFAPSMCAALQSPLKLACVNSIRTLLIASLIDHDAENDLYLRVKRHIYEICLNEQFGHYVLFEKDLLSQCGFGLDLTRCAVTNAQDNLAYVSPKTGRSVIAAVGKPYADQLFNLPTPLYKKGSIKWDSQDILNGLKITGHFLIRMLQEHLHRSIPTEREYLIKYFLKI